MNDLDCQPEKYNPKKEAWDNFPIAELIRRINEFGESENQKWDILFEEISRMPIITLYDINPPKKTKLVIERDLGD